MSVVHAGSANGTRVGRRRLQRGQPIALHACDVIEFGDVPVQFVPPTLFFAALRNVPLG